MKNEQKLVRFPIWFKPRKGKMGNGCYQGFIVRNHELVVQGYTDDILADREAASFGCYDAPTGAFFNENVPDGVYLYDIPMNDTAVEELIAWKKLFIIDGRHQRTATRVEYPTGDELYEEV